jgi:long-chain acyl-CoA synthetase
MVMGGASSEREHLAYLVRESSRRHASRPALRFQEDGAWRSIDYAEFGGRVRAAARALVEFGVEPGDRVGIFAPNSPGWAIADLGILTAGAVSVPIYATNTTEQAEYVAGDAGLRLLFVGDAAQREKVRSFRARLPGLRSVIALERTTAGPGDGAMELEDFLRLGRGSGRDAEVERRLGVAGPGDLATVIYTSGTTGEPRGAMLTHANFFHQFRALDERFQVGDRDRSLCFLPLSHVYERTWSYYVFRCGAENAYLANPRDVVAAMPQVRPTVMVSVPRLYEKICAAVTDRVEHSSRARQALFHWGLRVGSRYQACRKERRAPGPGLALAHRVADALVLSKIRALVGGPKNFLSAGGAPLAREVEEFFLSAGLLVCQGYGLTETSPMVSCNAPGDFRFGTVGRPVAGCEVRIADEGEVQVRGGNVMKGYLGRPAETALAFQDGWFRTGDVGHLDADGFLVITDRIKDLIITSQGKNVAPQHVASLFGSDPYVEHVAIVGDRRPYLAALVVPAFPALEAHAREAHIPFSTREELVSHPEIVAFYERRIEAAGRSLARHEQIKRFTLLSREFTQEGGELTPTQKVRRRVVETRYREVIDAMYATPGPAAGAGSAPGRDAGTPMVPGGGDAAPRGAR